jgi:hypothetical protein
MITACKSCRPAIVRLMCAALVVALVVLMAGVASACPTCKDGVAQNDPQGQSIAAGYYYSILFMMSMPYIVLGTFGSLAYLSIRRARQAQLASAGDAPVPDAMPASFSPAHHAE